MLLQLYKLDLLALLFDLLRLLLLHRIAIVKPVIGRVEVDVVTGLWRSLAVVINFKEAAIDFFAIHLDESLLGTVVILELDVCETLGLFSLPVVSDTNALNFSETTEPIADIIFFEVIWETFDKKCLAISRHQCCHF